MSDQSLSSLCSINSESLGPSTRADFTFDYIDISSVTRGEIDWNEVRRLAYKDAPSRARRLLRPGDVLLCTVRPGLQSHARITGETGVPKVGSTGFAVVRPNDRRDSSYVFHQIFSDGVASQLRAMETGSNYPAVNERDVSRLLFYTPDVDERTRIAVVLDAIDAAIAKSARVIAKLERVRAGLLHDLLTRGLDENGDFRDPDRHPEQFQGSPLGRIPKVWRVQPLGIWAEFCSGYAFKNNELTEIGWKVVRISNLHKPDFPYWRYQGPVRDSWIVEDGDLLFSWAGVAASIDAYIYRGERALLNQHIYNLRINSDQDRCFVFTFLQYTLPTLRRSIEGGAGQLHLSKEKIERIGIPKPEPAELAGIVSCVTAFNTGMATELTQLEKLKALKSGLMSDLLAGRVLVPETIAKDPSNGVD